MPASRSPQARRAAGGWFVALVCAAVAGCGSGLQLGKVTGKVTVAGQPLTTGTIMFHPETGPTAVGAINPDGSYALTTIQPGDGAVVGQHRVTIEATHVGAGTLASPQSFEEESKLAKSQKILVAGKVDYLTAPKYAQIGTTDLTAQVQDRDNQIDFDLAKP